MLENIQIILSVFASVFVIITAGFLASILIIKFYFVCIRKYDNKIYKAIKYILHNLIQWACNEDNMKGEWDI